MPAPPPRFALGMAMRFNVTVDGLNLGDWSGCTGLEMKAKLHRMHNPGNYSVEEILFADTTFETVKLERAIDSRSALVRRWVADRLAYWRQPGWSPLPLFLGGETATITLLDASWQPVTTWQLRNVYPLAWKGPQLAANKAAVATEKLELAHEGFL
jgi:phage tail-like protein